MKVFELLPRPLGKIFRKLTHLPCNSPTQKSPQKPPIPVPNHLISNATYFQIRQPKADNAFTLKNRCIYLRNGAFTFAHYAPIFLTLHKHSEKCCTQFTDRICHKFVKRRETGRYILWLRFAPEHTAFLESQCRCMNKLMKKCRNSI